ncbi:MULTISPECIES: hypothetical protein [Acinetobacter]|jgi:hypothetical protein|uniref:hypothetical protein n=1 Tax=Acinetobacter TaxID=469 RepID=UPI0003533C0B|nr:MULTISPECIES: hypothetical protein [Acinetobacter]EPG40628.1 hypothetical protein F910_00564 [Acinetobacter baumannii NIPH 410]MCJ8161948.1 hypothetical protein [Acinetobacter sp. A7.4]MDI9733873.1 hypothetical protein [Acinetobacter baumannii]OTL81070.1 hypothetical protein B9X62_17155 [Acinetobacter pittii]HDX6140359.1 hypothetical protein [Acinetobacter baumannii]
MNTSSEDVIIQNTVAAAIEIIAQNTPLREKSAKSTFIVSPKHHRHLDTVCKVTGKTKQDYYSLALDKFLEQKGYLEDIPLEQVKALAAL